MFRNFKSKMSFSMLEDLIKNNNIEFSTVFNYEEVLKESIEIKRVVDKIYSIVYKPHIKSDIEEVVLRSEQVTSVSNRNFFETIKDPKLWKSKDNVMTPEYVHTTINIDTIDTYENRFISLLISLLSEELKELLSELTPLIQSFEEKMELNFLTYGEHSILNDFPDNEVIENVFTENESIKAKAYKTAIKLFKRINILKETEFFRITSKHKPLEVMPTNILIHDSLYSYCYKFYKNMLLGDEKDKYLNDIYYHNYVVITLIDYIFKNVKKLGSTVKNTKLYFDENGMLHFEKFNFRNGAFKYYIDEVSDNYLKCETFYLGNDQVSKKEKNIYKSINYITTTYSLNDEFYAKFYNDHKLNDYGLLVVTCKNISKKVGNIMTISPYYNNHTSLIRNYFKSLSLLFECDGNICENECPVCGKKEVDFETNGYICHNCKSKYAILNEKKNLLWIQSFRRKSE